MMVEEENTKLKQREGIEKLLDLCRNYIGIGNYGYFIVPFLLYAHKMYIGFRNDNRSFLNNYNDALNHLEKNIDFKNKYSLKQLNILINLNDDFFLQANHIISFYFEEEPVNPTIFFDLLTRSKFDIANSIGNFFTPKIIAEKVSSLVKLDYNKYINNKENESIDSMSLLDIGSGIGGLLSEIISENKNIEYTGIEIDREVALLGSMYLTILGYNAKYIVSDVYDYFKNYHKEYDWVISNVPFGSKNLSEWIDLSINLSKHKTILVVPEKVLFENSKSILHVRRKLIDNDWLEAIISYPSGLSKPFSGVKASLIVINKKKTLIEKGKVRFEDFTLDVSKVNAYTSWKNKEKKSDYISTIKNLEDIQLNNYNLTANRYLNEFEYLPNREFSDSKFIKLDDLVIVRNGKSIDKSFITSKEGGSKYINGRQLSNELALPFFDSESVEYYLSKTEIIGGLTKATKDEILVAKVGTGLRPTLIKDGFVYFSNHIYSLKLKGHYDMSPEYLAFYLKDEKVKRQLQSLTFLGAVHRISIENLRNISIEVPTLTKQNEYVLSKLLDAFRKRTKVFEEERRTDIIEQASTLEHTLGNSISVIDNDIKLLIEFFNSLDYDPITNVKSRPEIAEKSRLSNILNRIQNEINSSRFALKNIDDWLAISKDNLNREETEIVSFFEDEIKLHSAQEDINITVESKKPLTVNIDRERFKILIRNFIENAKKHGFKNNFPQYRKIIFTIQEETLDNSIRIEVKNNGNSIDENFNLTTSLSSGTNKGLKLINNIVNAHDGTFDVASKEISEKLGFGSLFIIKINKPLDSSNKCNG